MRLFTGRPYFRNKTLDRDSSITAKLNDMSNRKSCRCDVNLASFLSSRIICRQAYIVYCYIIYGKRAMKPVSKNEEIRWQVMKAMLDEFPMLKEKTRKYLERQG